MTLSLSAFGQLGAVKFLGIPVDGTKEDMISQLKQKGYQYDKEDGCLKGEFNGFDANIFINTTKGKVDRIYVASQVLRNEAGIKVEFNNLISSFEKSEKYLSTPLYENEYIGDDEDISYEMTVKNKQYVAVFNQKLTEEEVLALKSTVIENFDVIKTNVKGNEILEPLINNDTLSMDERADQFARIYNVAYSFNNNVWFEIFKYSGQYYIGIYYDNLNNRPNGEDL